MATLCSERYFYDIPGQRLGTYELQYQSGQLKPKRTTENFYFAGKLIRTGDDAIAMDRLSSVRYRRNVNNPKSEEFHD